MDSDHEGSSASDSEGEDKGPASPSSDSRASSPDGPGSPPHGPASPPDDPASPEGPASPIEAPGSPAEGPDSPADAPDSPAEAPDSPAEAPDSPAEAPDSPAEGPASPLEGPASPPEDPASPLEDPASPPEEPASPEDAGSPRNDPASPPDSPQNRSRSHSPQGANSRSPSNSSDDSNSGPDSPASHHDAEDPTPMQMRNGRPRTPQSAPRSPESGPESPDSHRSRPRTPKSPDSHSRFSGNRSRSPHSRNSEGPRSPSPANSSLSRSPAAANRPPSPHDSRSNTPQPSTHQLPAPANNHHREDDRESNKSNSSRSSRKSKSPSPDRLSGTSEKSLSSRDSRRGRKEANLDDGNTSDSSESSVDSSSRKNKNISKAVDTQPEEISDGDIESDNEKSEGEDRDEKKKENTEINIAHDDLSDVSDLDDSIGADSEEELEKEIKEKEKELESKEDPKSDAENKKATDKPSRAEEAEEQLDFEAEDGECAEQDLPKEGGEKTKADDGDKLEEGETESEKRDEKKEREELEEGEVSDEDDARPEETEPRPVCRFFSRGQCTWGASCRFLHPGVTDKGNYTMFEMIRPVVPGEFRDERGAYGRPEPPPVESAWERGLRTAKEMLRKSMKRKEQDIDFEEKKMNLSLAQEELDKENGYYARAPSPEPRFVVRHPVPVEYAPVRPAPEEYYGRRQVIYEPEYVPPVPAPAPRERVRSYRELPSHRMPDYYNNKYEEDTANNAKARRPKREVIVQRAEERQARGDEWQDPWMRSKSPGARKGRKRSYSSGSSYSSSSSSGSSRSTYRSRSRSPRRRRSRSSRGRRPRQAVSPSVIVSERKAANERAALMNPPAPRKKAASPGLMRVGSQNPPAPSKVDQFGRSRKLAVAAAIARQVKGRQRSSRSSSDSSGSSSSDSESSDSSSSSSRDGSPPRRSAALDVAMALKAKAIDALKSGTEKRQIKLNLKNPVASVRKEAPEPVRKPEVPVAKKRPASSPPPSDKSTSNKKATSRREELLKQLKAVEDAIAKKRSKV